MIRVKDLRIIKLTYWSLIDFTIGKSSTGLSSNRRDRCVYVDDAHDEFGEWMGTTKLLKLYTENGK